jgi:hypothetical protein
MKKYFLILILALLLVFPVCVFAQTAKIIDFKGEVMVKKNAVSDWQDAKKNLTLDKAAQVQTKAGAECTLAFDEDLKNIVTVKENSQIRIDSLKPGVVNLSQGRVFTLIKNLKQVEKFQIKTPTAVAGARATGWETGNNNGDSSVSCFEDTVYVQGLDANGNVTDEEDLDSGFGLEVGAGGKLGGSFELGDDARAEWNDFTNNVGNLGGDVADQEEGIGERGALQDLRDEGRENYREEIAQEQREENQEAREEAISESSSGNETGGGSVVKY